MTIVSAYICPVCKNIIYSRAKHDFRWCSCKEIAVDGGFDYHKVSYMNKPPKSVTISIDATKEELYEDWNNRTDKFGIIKDKNE